MSDYYRIKVRFDRSDLTFVATEDVCGSENAAYEARKIASQLPPEAWVDVEAVYNQGTYMGTSLEQSGEGSDGR